MSESDSGEAPTPAKKGRRSFTAEKKLEIVAHAKSTSIKAAGKEFKVDRKNIREWKKMKRTDTPATLLLISMNDCIIN
jgi:transposase-like protein